MPYKVPKNALIMFGRRGDNKRTGDFTGFRDGMVGYLDESVWDNGVTLSDATLARMFVAVVDRSWLPALEEAVKSGKDIANKKMPALRYLDYKSYPTMRTIDGKTITDPEKIIHSPAINPVWDFRTQPQTDLKDATKKDWRAVATITDFHQVSQGSFTVGSAAQDYPTFSQAAGFAADIAADLTGDISGTQETILNEGHGTATYATNTNGFTLLLDCATPHNGDPTGGLLISKLSGYFATNSCTGTGTVEIRNFRTLQNYAGVRFIFTSVASTTHCKYHDNMVDGNGVGQTALYYRGQNNQSLHAYNNVFWGWLTTGVFQDLIEAGKVCLYENNAAWDCGVGYNFSNLTTITANNNMGWAAGTNVYQGVGNATGNNNIGDDGTNINGAWLAGAGNIINDVALANVQSLNPALATFMDIIDSGPSAGAGVANSIAERTTDIRGRSVPGIGKFTRLIQRVAGTSIGVAEPLAIGSFDNTIKFNSSTINCDNFESISYNNLLNDIDSDTSVMNVSADFDLDSKTTWNTSGLDYINFISDTSASPTLSGNAIGNVVINKTGGSLVTLQDAFSCYALTALSGDFDQNGQTITTSGDQIYTGGGTLTLDTSAIMLNDGDFIVSSGWTTLNTSAAEVDLRGTGSLQSDDSNVIVGKLTVANTGKTTTHNGTDGIACNGLVLSTGTLINNSVLSAVIDESNDIVLADGHTINGTSAFIIEATSAMSFDVSGMNVSGFTGPLYIRTNIDTVGTTFNLNEPITTGGDFYLYRKTGEALTIVLNEDLNIGGSFYYGNEL